MFSFSVGGLLKTDRIAILQHEQKYAALLVAGQCASKRFLAVDGNLVASSADGNSAARAGDG